VLAALDQPMLTGAALLRSRAIWAMEWAGEKAGLEAASKTAATLRERTMAVEALKRVR
jgi:hypothetical protein